MSDRYAVFGNPIAQSKSPFIHTMFAQQTEQDISYDKVHVAVDAFISEADKFFATGGKGLNITSPFKQDAFNYADRVSEGAQLAGAVNTLIKNDDASVSGENTDGIGLVNDIVDHLQWQIKDKNILLLGAGGAVRGVLYSLLQKQPKTIEIANRTLSKATDLATLFSDFGNLSSREFFKEDEKPFDIIINGTSASLSGQLPLLNSACIGNKTCVYDMVYAKSATPFMQWADELGAIAVTDGKGMLVGQAAESFRLWRGVRPVVSSVLEHLRSL